MFLYIHGSFPSLSARRVWIEITLYEIGGGLLFRHSPRGECGLKSNISEETMVGAVSLSARRVWIEILYALQSLEEVEVTLREESVD